MTDLALGHAARFVYAETDESGDPRLVGAAPGQLPRRQHLPRLRVIAVLGETPLDRAHAFAHNPSCVHCGQPLESADASGIVPTEQGPRLAHRNACFVQAMLTHNPHLALRAALDRAAADASLEAND
jgi:hypothetical protein